MNNCFRIAVMLIFFTAGVLNAQTKIVEKYGKLHVHGKYLMSEFGDTVQLRGMSLFWSQWMGQYYNEEVVKWLRDDWKCTVVRAAMGVEMGGYLSDPAEEKKKVIKVVDAAIEAGIYVIIDFHSHEAHTHPEEAKRFFEEMALKYGKHPHVLFELYNEPLKEVSWSKEIKPYCENLIKVIRKYAPDNIIICGTRQWSQLVSEAAEDPIKEKNIMYTLHYYAATHKQDLRDEATRALEKGIALFVTEMGICDASGNGTVDLEESVTWWKFLDKNKISWCNWSVADKEEAASVLLPGANERGGWKDSQLTRSGKFVRKEISDKNSLLTFRKK